MPNPATLFRIVSEIIVVLLGALLILLAATGRIGLPERPAVLVALGVVLMYWGARAWMTRRPPPEPDRMPINLRAGSLVLVGALVLAIPFLPVRHAETLLEAAGGVLLLRGLLAAIALVRRG